MLDFLGNEVDVGDTVVFCAPQYRHLCKGTVAAKTPKKIRIEYYNNWNYGKENPLKCEYIIEPYCVVKIPVDNTQAVVDNAQPQA